MIDEKNAQDHKAEEKTAKLLLLGPGLPFTFSTFLGQDCSPHLGPELFRRIWKVDIAEADAHHLWNRVF